MFSIEVLKTLSITEMSVTKNRNRYMGAAVIKDVFSSEYVFSSEQFRIQAFIFSNTTCLSEKLTYSCLFKRNINLK